MRTYGLTDFTRGQGEGVLEGACKHGRSHGSGQEKEPRTEQGETEWRTCGAAPHGGGGNGDDRLERLTHFTGDVVARVVVRADAAAPGI